MKPDLILNNMSLEEKIGQVMMPVIFTLNEDLIPGIVKKTKAYHLGGIMHSYNNASVIASCVRELQSAVDIPLLVGCDYEFGAGQQLAEGTVFPKPMSRAVAGDTNREYELGRICAREGRAVGANMNFSPVIDVNTDHLCPDVNVRAYGETAADVINMSVPYIRGLQENGMLATGKHFPGNGGTSMDQHIASAVIPHSREIMADVYLAPYKEAFTQADLGAIMVAHLEVPSLTTERHPRNGRILPASLSSEILQDLLRDKMGFQGLALSDALNMGGVTTHYERDEVLLRCINAGMDMILIFFPDDYEKDYDSLIRYAQKGDLDMERLDEAVLRVLRAKEKIGILEDKGMPMTEDKLDSVFTPDKHINMMTDISEQAVTVLRNKGDLLPLTDIKGKDIAVLNVFHPDLATLEGQGQNAPKLVFSDKLRAKGVQVTTHDIAPELTMNELKDILASALQKDLIFLNLYIVPNWGIGTLVPNKNAMRLFMFGIISAYTPLVITSFGDPYVMKNCPASPVYINAYDESTVSQETVVKAVLGEIPVRGRSPVGLEHIFEKGDGLDIG